MKTRIKHFFTLQCLLGLVWSAAVPFDESESESSVSSSEDTYLFWLQYLQSLRNSYGSDSKDEIFDSDDYLEDFEKPDIVSFSDDSDLFPSNSDRIYEDSYENSDGEDDEDEIYREWDGTFHQFNLLSSDDGESAENDDDFSENNGPYPTIDDSWPQDGDFSERVFSSGYDYDDYDEDDDRQYGTMISDEYNDDSDTDDHEEDSHKRYPSLSGDSDGIQYISADVPEYFGSLDD